MREIKFRAWHKEKEKMFVPTWINKDMSVGMPDNISNNESDSIVTDNIEIMQFTGLHDRGGDEIYEGDIVRVEFDPYSNDVFNENGEFVREEETYDHCEISEVKFENGGFVVSADFGDYSQTTVGWAIDDGSMVALKIIGNIYENPELLK